MDYKESNNCNGRLSQNPSLHHHHKRTDSVRSSARDYDNRNVTYDKISKHLSILVSKNDSEEEFQDIVNEWRLVAQIMDRFLFWLFLLGVALSSISILVFQPMTKPAVP